jgi:hypothetical protein
MERSAMPALDGILETALYVDDLDRARRFYEDVLACSWTTVSARMLWRAVFYCCSGAEPRFTPLTCRLESFRRTTAAVLCMLPLRLPAMPCRTGRSACAAMTLASRGGPIGRVAVAASISATPTGTSSNWRHPACGKTIDRRPFRRPAAPRRLDGRRRATRRPAFGGRSDGRMLPGVTPRSTRPEIA